MRQILGAFRRTSYGTIAALFLLALVSVALPARKATAGALLRRSLTLTSSQPSGLDTTGAGGFASAPGDPSNGDQVGHTYAFEVKTGGDLQALKFQYCDGPFGYLAFDDSNTCSITNTPDLSAANVDDGAKVTVWSDFASYDNNQPPAITATSFTTNGAASSAQELVIEKTDGPLTLGAGNYVVVEFEPSETNYFVNPSNNNTFFVHIETYASTAAAATEAHVDEGTVASSTANTIAIESRVAESLNFSVSTTHVAEGGQCDPLSGSGALAIGDPTNENALSFNRTYDGHSYFRLATNSSRGAKVLYSGETLTNAFGDTIAAMGATAVPSQTNTEQFGLAISTAAANNDVGMGGDLTPEVEYDSGAEGLDGNNNANGDYAFDTGSKDNPVPIASSTGVVSCDTGVVRYIANISTDTPAGIYTTKISYIAVPSY